MTKADKGEAFCKAILIHTSVKLVTGRMVSGRGRDIHFNPHEREARDVEARVTISLSRQF